MNVTLRLFMSALLISALAWPAQASPKKVCSAKQESTVLDLDRRSFSLNKILRDQSNSLAVNQELLSAANATNNLDAATRIGTTITVLKRNMESTQESLSKISTQRSRILQSCKSKGSPKPGSSNSASGVTKCNSTQLDLIRELSQQHENTLLQIQTQELEIYRQRVLAQSALAQGRSGDVAKANLEIQRRSSQAGDLAAYASIIARQFEVANASCSGSSSKLSDLLSKVFVPNSLIAMNVRRFESINKEITKPIVNATSGNLAIDCDNTATSSSSYSSVGVYFAFTTKKPEIWDRYNGAGVDSDAFTVAMYQPNYVKQPDSTFKFRDNRGNDLIFRAFKADMKQGVVRNLCEFEIAYINPSSFATNAEGIWFFVIASNNDSSMTIWSLSGFTIKNYLDPIRF